ncbi:MAG: DUF2007 domain-containing protein [Anaerolineales bacterium]|nr:DUF2007 domain-containing protein [Anaerolineales bacterium]
MQEPKWEMVDSVAGELQAELLRGYLEAQGIPVYLSQEGVGHLVYPVNVGPLARVDILVPSDEAGRAREALESYYAGSLEAPQDENEFPTENEAGAS